MDPAYRIQLGLRFLLDAHEFALELERAPWDFAVELSSLHELGLSKNDVRWLLYKHFLMHAYEVTDVNDAQRVFRSGGTVVLIERSCFVLTPEGVHAARLICQSNQASTRGKDLTTGMSKDSYVFIPAAEKAAPVMQPSVSTLFGIGKVKETRPSWDKDRRILFCGPHLVKQFKVQAPNQELILQSFEEESWPVRIDDPLPFHAAIDPKRRLHDTINSLNRNQRVNMLRFVGDGSGQAICWEHPATACGS